MSHGKFLETACCALLLVSCTTSKAASSSVEVAAGEVALDFTHKMLNSDFQGAQLDVAGEAVQTFRLITAGLAKSQAVGKGLKVGAVKIAGNDATVTLLGSFCPSPTVADTSGSCVTNLDSKSSDPQFKVRLRLEASGVWRVVFGPLRPLASSPTTS